MSLGPTQTAETEVKDTPIQRTRAFVGGVFKAVNENPAERLFYFGIALLLVGLPFKVEFPLAYYGVLALLGFILICRFALSKSADIKKEDHAI